MRSTLRRAAAALSITVATATAAHATEFGDTYFLTPSFGAGLTQYFPFFSSFGDGVAGDTFVDTFIFGTAPAFSDLKTAIFPSFGFDGNPEISFTSLILADAPPGDPVALEPFVTAKGPTFIRGSTTSLAAGTYYIQVSGTLLASEASYIGNLTDTVSAEPTPVPLPAIPEPSTAWLLALGLGGLGMAVRKQQRNG